MPGRRPRISSTAPVRNGRPPHTYMTVPSTGEIQVVQPDCGSEYPTRLANISSNATTGIANTSMIQKSRRNCATWSPWPPWPV